VEQQSGSIKDFLKKQGQTSPYPFLIEVDHARGSYIFAKDGRRYLDMIAGVAVNNIGHNHPRVVKALHEQIDRHLHVMVYGEFVQDTPLEMAQQLTALLPEHLNAVYAVNSGTEANEAALKLAKRVTGRREIIACKGAYHGSTHGSLSVSSNEAKKAPFEPLLQEIGFIELNNLDTLQLISNQTAAVIIETVQGDAGVRKASKTFLTKLRERCNATGTLLIFDEIQCGMGRTGKNFAFEHAQIYPDVLTLGKALGGGMPIGALVSDQKMLQSFTHDPMLGHITTFGGHPVVCAASSAFLDVLKNEIDYQEVDRIGHFIASSLEGHNIVKNVRREGYMFAIDLPSAEVVNNVVQYCLSHGVLTFWFLSHTNSFRLSPPLNLSMDEAQEAVDVIISAFNIAEAKC